MHYRSLPGPALGLDPRDNALAETVIGLYKTEVIHRRGPWRSVEAVEIATLEWVDWFNNRRLLEPIGNIPPAEAEARYYAQSSGLAMVAYPTLNSLRQTRCDSPKGNRAGGVDSIFVLLRMKQNWIKKGLHLPEGET